MSFSVKPKLYYPLLSVDNISIDNAKFNIDFNTISSMDLMPNGNGSSGENDFVVR